MFRAGERETGLSQEPGRVAMVSGGSRGIGAATVRRLAADGWDIGFSYHSDGPSAREVEKAAFELGVRATGTDVDVTDAAEVTSWFRLTEEEFGPVQAVVSCAGLTREGPLARLAEADWRMVIDTSLDGVFHLCRAAVFAMMERRSGRIVTVSSVCGEYDHVPHGVGTLARPGIAGFVRALASQTRPVRDQRQRRDPGPGPPATWPPWCPRGPAPTWPRRSRSAGSATPPTWPTWSRSCSPPPHGHHRPRPRGAHRYRALRPSPTRRGPQPHSGRAEILDLALRALRAPQLS